MLNCFLEKSRREMTEDYQLGYVCDIFPDEIWQSISALVLHLLRDPDLCAQHGIFIHGKTRAAHTRIEVKAGTHFQPLTWDDVAHLRSEEHTSELQSLMRISYAVFCLKQKTSITRTSKRDTNRESN